MMSSKKTSGNPFENSTQKWGTPKCRTHSPDDPNRRKKPIWTAQAIFDKNSDPYKNKVYFFSYKPLVEFDDINAYGEDLKRSIEAANSVVESCKISGDIKIIKSKIKEDLCDTCPRFLACTHQESFPSTYEIHCVLRVKGCPYCGGTLSYYSDLPTKSPAISDVRLKGYSTILYFDRDIVYWCDACQKTISGFRVPCVQEKKRGEITLRLLRSLFELSLDKIPNDYVAEGYSLTTDRVGKINRVFRTKTKKEFEAYLVDLFSRRTSKDFYEEPVFLDGKQFCAIFTGDKKTLLAILPEYELNAVREFLSGNTEDLEIFKSLRALNIAAQFCLTASPAAGREVIASAIKVFYAYSLDLKEDDKSGHQKRRSAPEWDSEREGQFDSSYKAFSIGLIRFIRNAFYCRPVNLEVFEWEMSELGRTIPSTYTRTLRQLKALKKIITEAQVDPRRWEKRFLNEEQMVFDWKNFGCGYIGNITRLDISELIESCSKKSDLSLYEQLARLQYYNELSVFPISPSEQEKFPVFNEKGWPSFENTRLGQGIPIECLTHLLKNGLLDKDSLPPACIRQRLGLYKHECAGGTCTIENCPFLG